MRALLLAQTSGCRPPERARLSRVLTFARDASDQTLFAIGHLLPPDLEREWKLLVIAQGDVGLVEIDTVCLGAARRTTTPRCWPDGASQACLRLRPTLLLLCDPKFSGLLRQPSPQ